jgi:hypothetical protein
MMYYLEHFNTLLALLVSGIAGTWVTIDSVQPSESADDEWQFYNFFSYTSMVAFGACVSQMLAYYGVVPSTPATNHITSAYVLLFGGLLAVSMTEPKFEKGELIFSLEELRDNIPPTVVSGMCMLGGGIHYLYYLIGKA